MLMTFLGLVPLRLIFFSFNGILYTYKWIDLVSVLIGIYIVGLASNPPPLWTMKKLIKKFAPMFIC